jgi:hypothetical protein
MTVRFVRNSLVALLLVACSGSDVTAPDRGRAPPQPTGTTTAIGVDPVTGASVETNQDDYVPGEIVHVVLRGLNLAKTYGSSCRKCRTPTATSILP